MLILRLVPQQAWIQSQAVFRSYPRKDNFVSDRVHAANTMWLGFGFYWLRFETLHGYQHLPKPIQNVTRMDAPPETECLWNTKAVIKSVNLHASSPASFAHSSHKTGSLPIKWYQKISNSIYLYRFCLAQSPGWTGYYAICSFGMCDDLSIG